jgi:hypothetical protein
MKKVQVRCVKGFGVIGKLHNIEVVKPLSGFGYSKRLYCCGSCGELFAFDLDNPELKGSKEPLVNPDDRCPNCQTPLKEHLVPYPENVFLSGAIESMDASTITFDRDYSAVEEFWGIRQ